MFNAPDRRSRWGALPIGHFVTRAIGYHLARTLPRGVTSADRRDHGNPGFDVLTLLRSWNPRDDLAAVLLRYICRATGMPETLPIVMPDGSTTTVRDAIRVYAGIFPMWVAREGRTADAMRAAAADKRHEDLAYFAQRLALRTASDLAVMGHTHVPVGGLRVSPVNYTNSGYECVARPDAPGRQFTFTQVDLERASAQVLAVVPSGGGFTVSPARAPSLPSVIVSPWMDYSCYARIENRSSQPLRLVRSAKAATSWWAVPPPALIAPRSVGNVWLQDSVGTSGSSGSFSYSDGTRTLDFAMACPTGLSANVVRSPVPDYETRTGGTTAWRRGGVDRFGHPVQARFFVGARVPGGIPAPAPPAGPGVTPGPGPGPRGSSGPAPAQESRYAVAARAILNRAGTPPTRGTVLTVAHLTANDGRPLLDPTTRPSRTSPRGEELVNPPNRLLGPQVQTITLPDGTTHRYVWTQPSVPPVSPPNAGGIAFLPPPGSATFTIVTFNVAGLDGDYRGRCTNGHHAESQLISFVNGNPAWRTRIGKLELHNRSRRGPGWGYSACNACLHDLAVFLTALNRPPRPRPVRASISWERLYDKNRACGHPTDAANIRRLVQAGWDEPMGPRPSGTRWPTPTPGRPRVPARPRVRTP
jgi:hypothetical protein